jgi:hypothetical protein
MSAYVHDLAHTVCLNVSPHACISLQHPGRMMASTLRWACCQAWCLCAIRLARKSLPFSGKRLCGLCAGTHHATSHSICLLLLVGIKHCPSTRFVSCVCVCNYAVIFVRNLLVVSSVVRAVQLSGMQHGKDRVLGFDPCCVSYYNNGEYLLVSGADKKATLMTKEGVKLSEITTQSGRLLC